MGKSIFNKLASNVMDMGRASADTQLGMLGMPDVVKDSDYENNFWQSYANVNNQLVPAKTAIAGMAVPGAGAALGATQQIGGQFNPQNQFKPANGSINPLNIGQQSNVQGIQSFANGGNMNKRFAKKDVLTEYYGGQPNEVDGINVAGKFKADDGEVSFKRKDGTEYMFSNRIPFGKKKTFAAQAKSIVDKSGEDKYDIITRQLQLEQLAEMQEPLRQKEEVKQFKKMSKGGKLPGYWQGGIPNLGKQLDVINPIKINSLQYSPTNPMIKRNMQDSYYQPFNQVVDDENNYYSDLSPKIEQLPLNQYSATSGIIHRKDSPYIFDGIQSGYNQSKSTGVPFVQPETQDNMAMFTPQGGISQSGSVGVGSNQENSAIPALSKYAMIGQGAANLAQGVMLATQKPQYMKFNPLQNVKFPRVNSNAAMQQVKDTYAGINTGIRKTAGSLGEYLANRTASGGDEAIKRAAVQQGYDTQNSQIGMQEAQANAEIAMQNAQMKLKVGDINAQEYDAIRGQWMAYLSSLGNQASGMGKDVMAYNNANQYAKATQRFKTPNGWYKLNPTSGEYELEPKKLGGKL